MEFNRFVVITIIVALLLIFVAQNSLMRQRREKVREIKIPFHALLVLAVFK